MAPWSTTRLDAPVADLFSSTRTAAGRARRITSGSTNQRTSRPRRDSKRRTSVEPTGAMSQLPQAWVQRGARRHTASCLLGPLGAAPQQTHGMPLRRREEASTRALASLVGLSRRGDVPADPWRCPNPREQQRWDDGALGRGRWRGRPTAGRAGWSTCLLSKGASDVFCSAVVRRRRSATLAGSDAWP
jgi:hypothetical protein